MSFDDIAALAIHDVKNRLAQLAGRAEARGDAETLHTALEAAATLTELLTFYRSERGDLAANISAHTPEDLLRELAAESSGCGGIALEIDCTAAPTLAFYDEALVRMVLANAVHNALRHARRRIVLTVAEQPPHVVFRVGDDGDGYPDSILADRGESAPVSREGTGLGLRLARRIAALHENGGVRGEVGLANADGAVFTLKLPA